MHLRQLTIKTLDHFHQLSRARQYELVCEFGTYLGSRTVENVTFVLYDLDGFFIEVKYDGATDRLPQLIAFATTRRLEPYLRAIALDFS